MREGLFLGMLAHAQTNAQDSGTLEEWYVFSNLLRLRARSALLCREVITLDVLALKFFNPDSKN